MSSALGAKRFVEIRQEAARLRDLLQMQSLDSEAAILSANHEFYAAFRQAQSWYLLKCPYDYLSFCLEHNLL